MVGYIYPCIAISYLLHVHVSSTLFESFNAHAMPLHAATSQTSRQTTISNMDPEGAYTRRKSFTTTSNGRVVPAGKKDPKGDIISPTNRVATDADQTRSNTRNDQYDGPVHSSKNVSSGNERFIISSVAIPIGLNTAEAELPEARVVPVINQAMGGTVMNTLFVVCGVMSFDVVQLNTIENAGRQQPCTHATS